MLRWIESGRIKGEKAQYGNEWRIPASELSDVPPSDTGGMEEAAVKAEASRLLGRELRERFREGLRATVQAAEDMVEAAQEYDEALEQDDDQAIFSGYRTLADRFHPLEKAVRRVRLVFDLEPLVESLQGEAKRAADA